MNIWHLKKQSDCGGLYIMKCVEIWYYRSVLSVVCESMWTTMSVKHLVVINEFISISNGFNLGFKKLALETFYASARTNKIFWLKPEWMTANTVDVSNMQRWRRSTHVHPFTVKTQANFRLFTFIKFKRFLFKCCAKHMLAY